MTLFHQNSNLSIFLSLSHHCSLQMGFLLYFPINMHYNYLFYFHISVHYATTLHCVACIKQALFDYTTSTRYVDQTLVGSVITTKSAYVIVFLYFYSSKHPHPAHFNRMQASHYLPCPIRHTRKVLKMIFQATRKLRSRMYFMSRSTHSSKLKSFRFGSICQ